MSERQPSKTDRRAGAIAAVCATFVFAMVGMAYAAVPLYEIFCQVTGYGGTTQRVEANARELSDAEVTVRFDGNTASGLPWTFRPNDREMRVRLGETNETSFRVHNDSTEPVTGMATYNVTPLAAGVYFSKIQCFCFNEQTLEPGETMDMPVVFYVDPDILESNEMRTLPAITLSYTFFPREEPARTSAAPKAGAEGEPG